MVEAQATAKLCDLGPKAGSPALPAVLTCRRARDAHVPRARRWRRTSRKVLRSAMANARQAEGFGGDVDRLFVSSRYADQGPGMKRVRPAPMGRAFRVVKRTTHLTVAVKERPGKKLAAGGSTASKSRAARVAGSKKAAGAQGATAAKSKAKAAAGTE